MICGRVCDWQIDWNDNTNTPSYFFSFSPPNMSEDIYSAIHIWWRVYQSATSFFARIYFIIFTLIFWVCSSRRLFIDSGIVEPIIIHHSHPVRITSTQYARVNKGVSNLNSNFGLYTLRYYNRRYSPPPAAVWLVTIGCWMSTHTKDSVCRHTLTSFLSKFLIRIFRPIY